MGVMQMAKEIDQIFSMLDWNNDIAVQQLGIALASKIQHLSVFMQPIEGKSLWENCARVIVAKDDAQLKTVIENFAAALNEEGAETGDLAGSFQEAINEKLEKYNIGEEINVIKIDGRIYII